MTRDASYRISPRIAWLDAADGGRDDALVWAADLHSGETYLVADGAWLLWFVLADGPGTAADLRSRLIEAGVQGAPTVAELDVFLDDLRGRGLLVAD